MNFGNKLRMLIEEKSISQKELAAYLNIAPSTVSSYTLNTREPDFATLKQIAEYFDVTTDYLLDCKVTNQDTEKKKELLRIFNSLSTEEKDICIEQAKVFLKVKRYKDRH